jgi:hypothetical protein
MKRVFDELVVFRDRSLVGSHVKDIWISRNKVAWAGTAKMV